jgi:hypothetical protein
VTSYHSVMLLLTGVIAAVVWGVGIVGCGGGGTERGDAPEPMKRGDEWTAGEQVDLAEQRAPVHDVYLGVSCSEPNSIKCDRVRIAVWLEEPADELRARVAGQGVEMEVDEREPGFWQGAIQPAGLLEGPLPPENRGGYRWIGKPPVSTTVRIEGRLAGGEPVSGTFEEVWLAAGWG